MVAPSQKLPQCPRSHPQFPDGLPSLMAGRLVEHINSEMTHQPSLKRGREGKSPKGKDERLSAVKFGGLKIIIKIDSLAIKLELNQI